MNAHLSRLRERTSAFRAHGVLYNDFDREQVGDHVAAVVPVMLVWLNGAVGIFGVSQSNFQRRHACRRTGSRKCASAQVWPLSVLTAISATSVSPAHAAPKTV